MLRRATLAGLAVLCCTAVPSVAQVVYQPTPAPQVSAASTEWYRDRQPIPFAGYLYYPAGPVVFFNGDRMVPTGSYRGVPLYADTLLEAYSVIFVPIGGLEMQPYERRRAGDSAGTEGSQPPSFPVEPGNPTGAVSAGMRPYYPDRAGTGVAGLPSEGEPLAGGTGQSGREGGYDRRAGLQPGRRGESRPRSSFAWGPASAGPAQAAFWSGPVESVRPPERNLGIWISYGGHRWHGAGEAIRLAGSGLISIGDYDGFPVFALTRANPRVIYIPSITGVVAPYELVR